MEPNNTRLLHQRWYSVQRVPVAHGNSILLFAVFMVLSKVLYVALDLVTPDSVNLIYHQESEFEEMDSSVELERGQNIFEIHIDKVWFINTM